MRNIANYDVTAACGYVGCPLNGFKNPLAPLSEKSVHLSIEAKKCWLKLVLHRYGILADILITDI